jgi:hypothetical protein
VTQVRGLVSRIALLLFDVDLAKLFMRAQSNPHVLLHCFSKLLPFRAQRGGRLRWGCSAGGPSCLAPLPFFKYIRGLAWALQLELRRFLRLRRITNRSSGPITP